MNSILFLYAFVGLFLISSVNQIVLGIFTKWNAANITFGILTLLWALYKYACIKIYNSDPQDNYLIYYECLWLIPGIGRILLMLFISFYTKIFNRKFFFVVLVLSIASFILNILIPCELIFDKSKGLYTDNNIISGLHTFLHGNLSPLIYYTFSSVALNYVYILVILGKYYQKMKSNVAIALLVVFGFRSFIILGNVLFDLNIPLPFLIGLSNITVVLTVMTLMSYDIKRAENTRISIQKNTELRVFKDKMIHYIVSEITGLVKNLSNSTVQLPKEEMMVSVKVNSSKILNHVVTVLDIYKHDEIGIKLYKSKCNLSQIVDGVRSKIELILDEKHIVFESNIEEDYVVDVDVTLIEKVFVNILLIIVEYLNVNQKITLNIQKQTNGMLIINISSNKTNFSKRKITHLPRKIFDDLFKNDYSSNFGFLFCKTVISAHNGEIVLDLKNDFAAISFTLPYYEVKMNTVSDDKLFEREFDYSRALFNTNELTGLYKYYEVLSETNLFEISKLKRLITEIEQDKTICRKWLSELNISILEMNNEKYQYLINLINRHK